MTTQNTTTEARRDKCTCTHGNREAFAWAESREGWHGEECDLWQPVHTTAIDQNETI